MSLAAKMQELRGKITTVSEEGYEAAWTNRSKDAVVWAFHPIKDTLTIAEDKEACKTVLSGDKHMLRGWSEPANDRLYIFNPHAPLAIPAKVVEAVKKHLSLTKVEVITFESTSVMKEDQSFAKKPKPLEPKTAAPKGMVVTKKEKPIEDKEPELDAEGQPITKPEYPFSLRDIQAYYDLQIAIGKDQAESVRSTRAKFKLKAIRVNPLGEVQPIEGLKQSPPPPIPAGDAGGGEEAGDAAGDEEQPPPEDDGDEEDDEDDEEEAA